MKSQVLFIVCDIIFLVRLQEKFEIDHSWERKGKKKLFIMGKMIITFQKVFPKVGFQAPVCQPGMPDLGTSCTPLY